MLNKTLASLFLVLATMVATSASAVTYDDCMDLGPYGDFGGCVNALLYGSDSTSASTNSVQNAQTQSPAFIYWWGRW